MILYTIIIWMWIQRYIYFCRFLGQTWLQMQQQKLRAKKDQQHRDDRRYFEETIHSEIRSRPIRYLSYIYKMREMMWHFLHQVSRKYGSLWWLFEWYSCFYGRSGFSPTLTSTDALQSGQVIGMHRTEYFLLVAFF